MYRIFCESYDNMMNSLDKDSARYRTMLPVALLRNPDKYQKEAQEGTELYKKASSLLFYMEKSIEKFPKFKAFLWTLESRSIYPESSHSTSSDEELLEQAKGINSILNLMYWQ